MRQVLLIAALAALPVLLAGTPVRAGELGSAMEEHEARSEEGWTFAVAPYFWVPSLEGVTEVKGVKTRVDKTVGEFFDTLTDHMDFAALAHLEAWHGGWGGWIAGLYLDLEADKKKRAVKTEMSLTESQLEAALAHRFGLTARGDIGGLGVGARLTWNIAIGTPFRLADWAGLQVGWRWLDTDYTDGSGDSRFVFDIRYAGPYFLVLFRF
jgi:hypothetical protein